MLWKSGIRWRARRTSPVSYTHLDALFVFGKKLLGQDGEESGEKEEKTEKQETQEEDQGNAADYQEPSQEEIDEISPESAQIEKTAGVKTGRLFLWQSETGGVCEAPYPAWEVSQLQLIWGKGEESADSSLPEEVDGNTYTFSAPCAAPLQGVVTSPYGWRDHPIDGEYKFHHGVDIGANKGTPIGSFAGDVYKRQDRDNLVQLLESGPVQVPACYRYFSILPIDEQLRGVTIRGAKYPLQDAVVQRDDSLTVSNEALSGEVTIQVKEGRAFLIFSR